MGAFPAGSVVLVPFPFSDLTQSKLRPAVVLADAGRGDLVLCQITSNAYADPLAVELSPNDVAQGSLHRISYARPGKLFTASDSLIVQQVATLTGRARTRIIDSVVRMFRPEAT